MYYFNGGYLGIFIRFIYLLTTQLLSNILITPGCELREVEGLDVWSGLLYHTLILDLAAVRRLEELISTQQLQTPNINLQNVLGGLDTGEALGAAKPRHKMVRVVNLDNL